MAHAPREGEGLVKMPKELLDMIKRIHIAALATVGPDGRPNVSPKGFTYLDEETLAYVDIYSARTLDNIRARPQVAVAIWDTRAVEGYQVKGTARIHGPGDPVYEEVVARYVRAHHPDGRGVPERMIVVSIKVEEVYSLRPEDRGSAWPEGGSERRSHLIDSKGSQWLPHGLKKRPTLAAGAGI